MYDGLASIPDPSKTWIGTAEFVEDRFGVGVCKFIVESLCKFQLFSHFAARLPHVLKV